MSSVVLEEGLRPSWGACFKETSPQDRLFAEVGLFVQSQLLSLKTLKNLLLLRESEPRCLGEKALCLPLYVETY